ncbi:MAG: DNA repair exonuclease [Oscillospiraceae bacterium]|nr:DNA repair exonuclease [Oscillospiraceae bacterium]
MKLLHAADFHLDSPLSGLPAEKSAQRRRELREVPARLARLAREEQVDLVLLPGDLLDGGRVYPETLRALARALGDMAVPVFIAPGNHDYLHPQSPYAASFWPDNVHIFTEPALQSVELPQLNCVVHGCAFTAPHREDDPLAGFTAPDDGALHLLCVHGEVGTAGSYAPIDPNSLENSGAAYAALGHVHAAGSGKAGKTLWAYPGCPEGRGFDELGSKGALIVSFDAPAQLGISSPDGPAMVPADLGLQPVAAKFVPVCKRQYRIDSVEADDFTAALPQGESPDLVRLLLTGESRFAPDLAALAAQAAPHFFHVELQDRTTLPQDLWARADEDTLTGLFLREMKSRLEGAEEGERDKLLLAARFGLAALEGGEDIRP